MVDTRIYRDQEKIPQDPEKRRESIRWLFQHKVWTHSVTIKMPPWLSTESVSVFSWDSQSTEDWEKCSVEIGCLQDCWCVSPVYVNPQTEEIEEDDTLNTGFRVWIEAGPWVDLSSLEDEPEPPRGWDDHNRWGRSHDCRLDCGGPTMEDALLELATLVKVFYREDGTDTGMDWCRGPCRPDSDGFCILCGFRVDEDEDED